MAILRTLITVLALPLGILAIIAGESDDSPGFQGLGLILIVVLLFSLFRQRRRQRGK
jgi:hypothetical protein